MKLTETKIKKIIQEELELMEMEFDPTTLMLGATAVFALYKMFFGREPSSNQEALDRVREYIKDLDAKANAGDDMRKNMPKPPGQPDLQKQKARARLAQLKKQRGM